MSTPVSTSPLPTTLEGLLLESQRLYTKVSNADFDDGADREYITHRARAALESLQMGVAREGVFSVNEDIGEIATPVLPLLATDFYLGSLMIKLPFTRPQVRLEVLKQAEALLFQYLDTCERLELFDAADLTAWQTMRKEGESSMPGQQLSLNREQKIERHRRRKGIEQKMKEIEDELTRAEGKDCEDEGSDMKRERSFLLLASLASDALDEVSGIIKETEMLEHLVKAMEQGKAGPDGESAHARREEANSSRDKGLEIPFHTGVSCFVISSRHLALLMKKTRWRGSVESGATAGLLNNISGLRNAEDLTRQWHASRSALPVVPRKSPQFVLLLGSSL